MFYHHIYFKYIIIIFIFFTKFLDKTNGQTCVTEIKESLCLERREYSVRREYEYTVRLFSLRYGGAPQPLLHLTTRSISAARPDAIIIMPHGSHRRIVRPCKQGSRVAGRWRFCRSWPCMHIGAIRHRRGAAWCRPPGLTPRRMHLCTSRFDRPNARTIGRVVYGCRRAGRKYIRSYEHGETRGRPASGKPGQRKILCVERGRFALRSCK
jgi:hypothetical protein